jgi:radical SAM protein with 4Fe4S-binding SPASM domain
MAGVAKYDMPRWLYDRIAAQVFPRANVLVLSILTEPFMTRDFPERLAAVREHGVPYSEIITNGTLLTERNIGKVLDAEIAVLTVSIDGGTAPVYEKIRTGARFDQVVENVRLFQRLRRSRGTLRPALRINHVLSELNVDHFDEFLEFVEALCPEKIGVRTVSRMSDAVVQQSSDPAFWAKIGANRAKLSAFCGRTRIENAGYLRDRPTAIDLLDHAGEKLICRAPWENIAIHANGDVFPCMAWTRPPIGNFIRQSLEEIWEGDRVFALRREFAASRPGLDCLHCTIRRGAADPDDDFFYRKVARPLPA